MEALAERFFARGWCRFPPDPALARWAAAARPVAEAALEDRELRARWMRCGGTWFVGVHALPNDAAGAIAQAGVPPLPGPAVTFTREVLGFTGGLDQAQVSVCLPGYPRPWEGESEAAFRYRLTRDAAHVDGLRRSEPGRRRRLGEAHAFILGVPLSEVDPAAAPFVVWEGSHEIVRAALAERLAGIPPARWPDEDITEAYHAARRAVFDRCPRVAVPARPGEAYIVHRLALHGVAPWGAAQETRPRMIAYFRPELPGADRFAAWLELP